MLLMHLRHGRWYYLGYCSDMRTEVVNNGSPPSLYCWHAGGKALQWLTLPVVHVLICRRSSLGGTSGYNAGALAAYENQA